MALVILAGGSGQRFWPLSTSAFPKQFLDLEGCGRSLLQSTYDRAVAFSGGTANVFVLTGARYEGLVRGQLPDLSIDRVLVEPVGRDTAPAVALALLEIRARMGDVVMAVLPSDHRIADEEAFGRALDAAYGLARDTRGIVTLGVTPDRPATGFGYIERGDPVGEGYRVSRFVEKPDADRAAAYLEAGSFSWNAGIFVFSTLTMYEELSLHAPEILRPMEDAYSLGALRHTFARVPKRSLDYAVLEKTDRAFVVPASFGWDDLGDWAALERIGIADPGAGAPNTVVGRHVGIDTEGSIIYNHDDDGVIATFGVRDVVIVRRGGAVLLVAKDRVQDIKRLIQQPELLALDLPPAARSKDTVEA